MDHLGIIRVAAASPKMLVANPEYNIKGIIECVEEAAKKGASVILFPELSITGYTCGDLFAQSILYEKTLQALNHLVKSTEKCDALVVVGLPVHVENNYYNCAAVIQNGEIKGIVPKVFIPNSKEYYEERWFVSGSEISSQVNEIYLMGKKIPFGNLIFEDIVNDTKIGIEICEDLWAPISPGAHLALNGAHILLNLSASNEMVGKSEYRKRLVLQESAKNICGYVYASSGVHESTTDLVFGGDCIICENGILLSSAKRFAREDTIIYGEIDVERLKFERAQGQTFSQGTSIYTKREMYRHIQVSELSLLGENDCMERQYPEMPFVPTDKDIVNERCEEIFNIQSAGLAKRIEHTGLSKMILGISGGLDSTLALLVCIETCSLLGISTENIIAVTMPGFGTTDKTYNNALSLMKLLNTQIREIPIEKAVMQHFEDIGHDPNVHDVIFENAQARERTQILMDIANKENGLVIGTGDLSETALGWATYNGDHMSMYAVNISIPKTLVRFIIEWVMKHKSEDSNLKNILQDILDTPISPELLPPDPSGEIIQKTEDTVGPYTLHDFFLYYTMRYGMKPRKLYYIAKNTFSDKYSPQEIKKWLKVFYKRFFSQQFKRSCMPDGPKVGTVSLSPRGDWRMPSDADAAIWIKELEE